LGVESLGSIATSLISGTVVGILVGYAVKKVLRIVLVILGTFFAALAYLNYQGLLSVNWEKMEIISRGILTTLVDSEITGNTANPILSNLGLPLTGGMAMGFALGFVKG
jgi:uncharacterized membrane protein (Fun14 family)